MGFDLIYLFEGISLWPFNAGMVQRATSDKNFLFFLYAYTLLQKEKERTVYLSAVHSDRTEAESFGCGWMRPLDDAKPGGKEKKPQ